MPSSSSIQEQQEKKAEEDRFEELYSERQKLKQLLGEVFSQKRRMSTDELYKCVKRLFCVEDTLLKLIRERRISNRDRHLILETWDSEQRSE